MRGVGILATQLGVQPVLGLGERCRHVQAEVPELGGADGHEQGRNGFAVRLEIAETLGNQISRRETGRTHEPIIGWPQVR